MYEAFDKFLARDTWHTSHPLDEREFYRCLHEVVHSPNFNPDQMGEYFRQKKAVSQDHLNPLADAIDRWVGDAWAVRGYLEATGGI